MLNNKIVIFGGILEVTKESDEIFVYDIVSSKWSTIENTHKVIEGGSPVHRNDFESSTNEKDTATHKKE